MNLRLIKDLDFGAKLNQKEAVTEAGKECLKKYRGYTYTNPVTCGVVNAFVNESQKFTFDTGLMSILESVLSFITENNISWKLASVCESIGTRNSQYDYIAKNAVKQVEKLLEMKEKDVVSYIKAGVLKNVQYVTEFRNICKEVYGLQVNEVHTMNYNVTTPVSYVITNENKETFINILGNIYKIDNDKVVESSCEDPTFLRINNILSGFRYVDESLVYNYQFSINSPKIEVVIKEECENGECNDEDEKKCKDGKCDDKKKCKDGKCDDEDDVKESVTKIYFTRGDVKKEFTDVYEFRQYGDNLSSILFGKEKMDLLSIVNCVSEVVESFDNIMEIDSAKILECANGAKCIIVEGNNNIGLTVLKSPVNMQTYYEDYDFMVEALKKVEKLTSVNLNSIYEERIDEDLKKQKPDEYKKITEELNATKAAQLDIRRKKIEMLAEEHKNDPAVIALLNTISKNLSMLE